ncbi:MAG: nitroreductase [Rhodomicrobium sp.]
MDLREAIYSRRAVRAFTDEPVDQAMIRELIGAAIQAPSAVNRQAWSFTVVREKALLASISQSAKAFMLKNLPTGPMANHFQQLLGDPNFDIFYHAPVLIVISHKGETSWAIEDCTLAAQNMMLAARAAGLGTCWIGFSQAWLATGDGKAALGLSAEYLPVAPIIVGHPKFAPPPVVRKEPEIHWIG